MTWEEIGKALGVSAAHARVIGTRALDRCYDEFVRRGIDISTLKDWLPD